MRGWWRLVTPWAVTCCMTWFSAVRSSSIGSASCSSGIGRPSRTSTTSGIDGICIAWAIAGRGVDVDQPGEEAALELVGQGADVVGEGAALRHPGPRVEHQQDRRRHRRLEHLLEVLLGEVDGVRRTGAARRSGTGRCASCGGAGSDSGTARRRSGGRRRAAQGGQVDRTGARERLLAHGDHLGGCGETGASEVPRVATRHSRGMMTALTGRRGCVERSDVRLRGSSCPRHGRYPWSRTHHRRRVRALRRPGDRHRHPVTDQRVRRVAGRFRLPTPRADRPRLDRAGGSPGGAAGHPRERRRRPHPDLAGDARPGVRLAGHPARASSAPATSRTGSAGGSPRATCAGAAWW